eukprot:5262139-Prymnesium_polylepis.1
MGGRRRGSRRALREHLVDDDVRDALERAVAMELAQQHAGRAEEQPRRRGPLRLEPDLVAD